MPTEPDPPSSSSPLFDRAFSSSSPDPFLSPSYFDPLPSLPPHQQATMVQTRSTAFQPRNRELPRMPRPRRGLSRPATIAPLTIDLTDSSPPTSAATEPPRRKRQKTTPAASRPSSSNPSSSTSNTACHTPGATIDLTDGEAEVTGGEEEDEDKLGKKTQVDAIAGQHEEEKQKKLSRVGCIICMEDDATDLSFTPCGHIFCHLCLFGAVKASAVAPHKQHGRCPVCRGRVAIKDIVALEIKKRSKGKDKGKERARD